MGRPGKFAKTVGKKAMKTATKQAMKKKSDTVEVPNSDDEPLSSSLLVMKKPAGKCSATSEQMNPDGHGVRTPPAITRFLKGAEKWGTNQVQSLNDWVKAHAKRGGAGDIVKDQADSLKSVADKKSFASKLALCKTDSDICVMEDDFRTNKEIDTVIHFNDYSMYQVMQIEGVPHDAPASHIDATLNKYTRLKDPSKPGGFKYLGTFREATKTKHVRGQTVKSLAKKKSTPEDWDKMKVLMDQDHNANKARRIGNASSASAKEEDEIDITILPKAKARKNSFAKAKAIADKEETEEDDGIESLPLSAKEKQKARDELAKSSVLKSTNTLVNAMSKKLNESDQFQAKYDRNKKNMLGKVSKQYEKALKALSEIRDQLNIDIAEYPNKAASEFSKDGPTAPKTKVENGRQKITDYKKAKEQVDMCIDMA